MVIKWWIEIRMRRGFGEEEGKREEWGRGLKMSGRSWSRSWSTDVKQGSSVRVRDLAKDEGQGGRH